MASNLNPNRVISRPSTLIRIIRYLLAIALTALTFFLHNGLDIPTSRPLLILFVVPVLLSSYIGGLGPGLLASIFTFVGTAYLLPPEGSFQFNQEVDRVQWIAFLVSSMLICLITYGFQRSIIRYRISEILEHQAEIREQSISQERQTLLNLIDGLPIMITIYRPELRSFRFNRKVHEVLGLTERDAEGDLFSIVFPNPALREKAQKHMLSLSPEWLELMVTAKDGSQIPSAWTNVRISEEMQVGIGLDLREQKRSQLALQKSEERYRELFETMQEAFLVAELITDNQGKPFDWRVLESNPRHDQFLGQPHEKVVGHTYREIVKDPDPFWIELYGQVARTGQPVSIEQYTRNIGRWIRFNAYSPRPGQIAAVFSDITERKQAEDALRESEEKFRSIADNMAQLAWMTDGAGIPFWYNKRWYEYSGATPDEMSGRGWHQFIHPDDLQRVVEKSERDIANGQPWEDKFRIKSKGGDWRWFLSRALPIRDESGKVTRWFGSSTDITGELKVQDELRQKERELTEAIQARDQFLSIASHELKTPLSSLKIHAQMLKRSIEKGSKDALAPEQISRMAFQTDRQVSRLVRLVDDMLDVSRIDSGRLVVQREKMDFCEMIGEVVDRLRPQMVTAGTVPEVSCAEGLEGFWDRFRIEQVVINLLTNAMRYGNGKPVRIQARRLDSERVLLSVQDQGLGISEEDRNRIFERFERAISSAEISGLGLGLFISREIVRLHGGKMWVESELGKGSTFYVELPLGGGLT